jgi:hypothetical protein
MGRLYTGRGQLSKAGDLTQDPRPPAGILFNRDISPIFGSRVRYGKNAGMKWAAVYVLTALITGLHNFYRLMNMVNGAPISLLNCISLLGSATLLIAAVLMPLRSHSAAKVGLFGSILSWVFYAPLIVLSFIMPFSTWQEIQLDASFRDYVPLLGRFLGTVLLILCTVYSIILLKRNRATPRVL